MLRINCSHHKTNSDFSQILNKANGAGGFNNFTKSRYFISNFVVLLQIYKLFVTKLLIAQRMDFFPFPKFKSDKRSDETDS